jgi:type I restriction enzyme S subunit
MALNEIATFKYGFTAKAKHSGDYRFIRITDIMENGNLSTMNMTYVNSTDDCEDYRTVSGDILMARTGATFGKTVLIDNDDPAIYASYLIKIEMNKDVILPAYYWHFAQSSLYWKQASRLVSGGGQQQFNANVLKNVLVPVPSLEAQERIISILDKFDALVNNISEGLPAEIIERRQQYEHCRNKLLTFQEAA